MAKKQTTNYGWIYDKSGNVKKVYPPVTENLGNHPISDTLVTVTQKPRTLTGGLHSSVGFSMPGNRGLKA